MASHITRIAIGTINDVNRRFETIVSYRPGTVHALLNGQWLDFDQWSELGGNEILMTDAPRVGDVLQIQFIPV